MNDKIKPSLIEYLLSALDEPKKDMTDIINQMEQSGECQTILEAKNIHTANLLMDFADQMPGGFFIYRADEKEEIIYANKAMLRILNCRSMEEFREVTGNSFRGLVHPDDLQAVEDSIAEQIANSQYDLDYVEYRVIPRDGGIRWIDDYGHFIHSKIAGDIFYVFAGDATEKRERILAEKRKLVTENHRIEAQLQNQMEEYDLELNVINQEHLRRLEMIEGLSIDYESIFYVDLDMDKIKAYRVSNRFEKQFPKNHPVCDFVGFDDDYIQNWVYPDDRKLVQGITTPEYIRKQLSAEKAFHVNYRIFRNGKPSYIQLRIVNVGNGERVSQVVLGYRNIDDEIIQEMKQKQLLTDALNDANLANNAKNLFLSNMSHDIRTPMNAIIGFTSLARKHLDNREKISGYLDMISTSGDQLLQLLNDVLEISRIASGKVSVEEMECNLLDIVHEVQAQILPRITEKNISLSLDISRLQHDAVYSDPKKIRRIISYLVDNAIKYTNPDGEIAITVAEQNTSQQTHSSYQFVIKDNGIGINEDFLPHLFEPFEREKNTTLSGIYGTGLGLTITKDLVDMMGGTIEVSSVVNKGSQFTVTIPLRLQNQQPAYTHDNNDADDIPMHFTQPKRILIVDDNDINLEIESEVLKAAGFLVETAADGSIAVDKMKQSQPGYYDLILMDIQMPIMNGYNATRAIREIDNPALSNVPIIAVSANTFEEDKRRAIESGMNAHLGKPLNTVRLFKLIREFLKEG